LAALSQTVKTKSRRRHRRAGPRLSVRLEHAAGQALWLKELQTYIDFPPLQDPASYNLDQVMRQVQQMKSTGLSD
jgi:hypothetical protein